jgi:hypothetical protein
VAARGGWLESRGTLYVSARAAGLSKELRMRKLALCGVAGFALGAVLSSSGCSKSGGATNHPDSSSGAICPTNPDDLISDFTTDNGVTGDGKIGGWYTYGDKSGRGTLVPAEGGGVVPDLTVGNPSCSGPGSLHVTGAGFADWGAAMGADFKPKMQSDAGTVGKGSYDASKYRGISFYAKAAAPVKFVQVALKDPQTDLPSILPLDAQCVFDATMPTKNCSPYLVKFGYGYLDTDAGVDTDFPAYLNYKIDTNWKRFEILFSETKQDRTNPGIQDPGNKLDTAHLTGMSIQVNSDHSTVPPTPTDFEIWVDDITFIR